MRQHDMGREYSMHGRNTRHIKCLQVIYKGRGYSEVVLYECNKTILEKREGLFDSGISNNSISAKIHEGLCCMKTRNI